MTIDETIKKIAETPEPFGGTIPASIHMDLKVAKTLANIYMVREDIKAFRRENEQMRNEVRIMMERLNDIMRQMPQKEHI